MVPYAELDAFFTGLVAAAQSRGITCAITSGMACVHFGVAATTRDCDVLCTAAKCDDFRTLIAETSLRGTWPEYRGNISPPLDVRWMSGGWTAHFTWQTRPEETCLDVFSIAPRASLPWEQQLAGIYANPNVVAEMKRTNRDKDWPYATALGAQMLAAGDLHGWLHLYDPEVMRRCAHEMPPDKRLEPLRPVLKLSPFADSLTIKRVLLAERQFWRELDEIRIHVMKDHLRPYVSAVRRASAKGPVTLAESHEIRVACALIHLPCQPLRDYGIERMIREAKANVAATIHEDVLEWLPAAEHHFCGL